MLPSLAKIPFVFNYSGTLRGVTAVAKLLSLFIFAAQILTIFPISSASAQVTPERPVVIIPGILGSKLCERASGKTVWGNVWSYTNFTELALPTQYDVDQLPHVSCGLIEAVNLLGPFKVHQYDDLLKTLSELGYRKDKSLFVFDYDWRLSNRESARQLHEFVTKNIPSGSLDLITHSMGGIVAKLWMAEYHGAPRVSTLVTLGTPHRGSASTFKTLDEGLGFWQNLAAHGVNGIRETAMTFPSLYELLPSYQRCCAFKSNTSKQDDYFDPFDSRIWKRFSWVPPSFASDQRQAWLQRTLADAKAVADTNIPQGPRVVMIVTGLIPTAWRVTFDPRDGRVLKYVDQAGDGTVNQWSAANDQLVDARPALTIHATIFADDASRQVLGWVLTRGKEPTKGVLTNIRANLRTKAGIFIPVMSAAVEIDPQVLEPRQRGRFIVELEGEQDLVAADLSNVAAFVEGVPPLALAAPQREVDSAPSGRPLVRLVFPFEAPATPGSFAVTVNLPSVADLSDVGLVVPR
jgi:pimeloyl-ACP methyl ester carboxylesterase